MNPFALKELKYRVIWRALWRRVLTANNANFDLRLMMSFELRREWHVEHVFIDKETNSVFRSFR